MIPVVYLAIETHTVPTDPEQAATHGVAVTWGVPRVERFGPGPWGAGPRRSDVLNVWHGAATPVHAAAGDSATLWRALRPRPLVIGWNIPIEACYQFFGTLPQTIADPAPQWTPVVNLLESIQIATNRCYTLDVLVQANLGRSMRAKRGYDGDEVRNDALNTAITSCREEVTCVRDLHALVRKGDPLLLPRQSVDQPPLQIWFDEIGNWTHYQQG